MNEAFFSALVVLAGFCLLSRLQPTLTRWTVLFCAWPVGCIVWLASVLSAFLVGGAAWLAGFFFINAFLVILVFWWRSKSLPNPRRVLLATAIGGGAALLSLFVQALRATQGSYDTFELIATGRSLLMLGFRDDVTSLLASWGVLVPIVQGGSVLTGNDYVASAHPFFFLSLLGVFYSGIRTVTESETVRLFKFSSVLLAAATVLIGSTYFYLWQATYIHNSLPSAVYLLIYFVGINAATREGAARSLGLAFLGLLGFTFCRTEAPMFAALALVVGASLLDTSEAQGLFRKYSAVFLLVVLAWYSVLLWVIGAGSDILTPSRVALQLSALVLAAGLIFAAPKMRIAGILIWNVPTLVLLAVTLLAGIAMLWKPEHFGTNVNMVLGNMLSTGRWGATWTVAFAVLALSLIAFRSRGLYLTMAFVGGFLLLVFFLGLFRPPYRIGWGDSANRIVTHLLPVLLMGVVLNLLRAVRPPPDKDNPLSPRRMALSAFLASTLVTAALATPYLTRELGPKDLNSESRVLQAEGFCPPDQWGEYGFDMAMNPRGRPGYAAACGSGARSVLLELPYQAKLSALEFLEHSPGEEWRSFSILTSVDGKSWEQVFDTDAGAPGGARFQRTAPGAFSIAFPAEIKARFLRIDYRSSSGQNRLLLKKMAIIEAAWGGAGRREAAPEASESVQQAPLDLGPEARVVRAEGFCPPDQSGEYGFDMALNSRGRTGYAAACGTGARSVSIQLPRPAAVRWLEFHEYAPTEAWKSFSVFTSPDGQSWRGIFDSSVARSGDARMHRIAPGRFRLNLIDVSKIQFLKIEYRSSLGQNRLLLNKLSIFEDRRRERSRDALIRDIGHVLGVPPAACAASQATIVDGGVVIDNNQGVIRRIAYNACGVRVPAYLAVPRTASRTSPVVVALPQTSNSGKDEVMGFAGDTSLAYGARLYAAGFVVLAPDEFPQAVRSAAEVVWDTSGFYQEHPNWSAMGRMFQDHKAGVDALLHDRAPSCVAVIGHSLGGHNGLLLAALDQRVDVAVSSGGFELIATDESAERWARESSFVYMPRVRSFVKRPSPRFVPFDFDDLLRLTWPRSVMVIQGRNDPTWTWPESVVAAVESVSPLYRRSGGGEVLYRLHDEQHLFPEKEQASGVSFIRDACARKDATSRFSRGKVHSELSGLRPANLEDGKSTQ